MQLRHRIIAVFLISIAISILLFTAVTVWMLQGVLWSGGINDIAMRQAAHELAAASAQSENVQLLAVTFSKSHPGMDVQVLSDKLVILASSATPAEIGKPRPLDGLFEELSQHGNWNQDHFVTARKLTLPHGQTGYVVVSVKDTNYQALHLYINHLGKGILGKIFLTGVLITYAVTVLVALAFTKGIHQRFDLLYDRISSFSINSRWKPFGDPTSDEIGRLSRTFDSMAQSVQSQIDRDREALRARQNLVMGISHDLRTPLTSILGYAEHIRKHAFCNDKEDLNGLEVIQKSATDMDRMLDQLLGYLKYEYGVEADQKSNVDLGELCRELLIEFLPRLEHEGIRCEVSIEDDLPLVFVDRNGMGRVVRNLIDNAIRYGAEGKMLGIRLERHGNQILLGIKNYGATIESDRLAELFIPYRRGEVSEKRHANGMGLGLCIVKGILAGHGAVVEVSSNEANGTEFVVALPLEQCQAHF